MLNLCHSRSIRRLAKWLTGPQWLWAESHQFCCCCQYWMQTSQTRTNESVAQQWYLHKPQTTVSLKQYLPYCYRLNCLWSHYVYSALEVSLRRYALYKSTFTYLLTYYVGTARKILKSCISLTQWQQLPYALGSLHKAGTRAQLLLG